MHTEPYILFIDATVRPHTESRTWRLCERYLQAFRESHPFMRVRHLELAKMNVKPKNARTLRNINRLLAQGKTRGPLFAYAREFAAASRILVGAPYWDFSFPALLKMYFENVCIDGVTFIYENNRPKGLCRAEKLDYISTGGGYTEGYDLGSDYVCKLCTGLLGVKTYASVMVDKLDIVGEYVEARLHEGFLRVEQMARM